MHTLRLNNIKNQLCFCNRLLALLSFWKCFEFLKIKTFFFFFVCAVGCFLPFGSMKFIIHICIQDSTRHWKYQHKQHTLQSIYNIIYTVPVVYLYMEEEVKLYLVACTGYMCVLYSLDSFFGLLFSTYIYFQLGCWCVYALYTLALGCCFVFVLFFLIFPVVCVLSSSSFFISIPCDPYSLSLSPSVAQSLSKRLARVTIVTWLVSPIDPRDCASSLLPRYGKRSPTPMAETLPLLC